MKALYSAPPPLSHVFLGKCLENQRGRYKVNIALSEERVKRLAANPRYHSHRVINQHAVAVFSKPALVRITKPILTGICTLELSKYELQQRYHEEIARACGGNGGPEVIFSDVSNNLKCRIIKVLSNVPLSPLSFYRPTACVFC